MVAAWGWAIVRRVVFVLKSKFGDKILNYVTGRNCFRREIASGIHYSDDKLAEFCPASTAIVPRFIGELQIA
jgi:hypothetical protein